MLAVAVAQVVTLGLWWLLNEFALRDLTGLTVRDRLKFLAVFGGAGICYWIASRYGHGVLTSMLLYYASLAVVLDTTFRAELRLVPKLLAQH